MKKIVTKPKLAEAVAHASKQTNIPEGRILLRSQCDELVNARRIVVNYLRDTYSMNDYMIARIMNYDRTTITNLRKFTMKKKYERMKKNAM